MQDLDDVHPRFLALPSLEENVQAAEQYSELVVGDAVHQDAAGVGSLLRPPARKVRREIRYVARHEGAVVQGRELENLGIVETLELRLLAQRSDVVALVAQAAGDHPPGHVCVEE